MKTIFLKLGIASVLMLFIVSCQKDVIAPVSSSDRSQTVTAKKISVERPYKNSFDSWFNFVPADGWTPAYGPMHAYYPGGGVGLASQMGTCNTYFNQFVALSSTGFGSVSAPVSQFFSNELAAAGYTDIPDNISAIIFDKQGNSVWFAQTSSVTTPVSDTKWNFLSKADIVGGTGKFEGATGSTTINGYLNPQDPTDAGFSSEGTIKY